MKEACSSLILNSDISLALCKHDSELVDSALSHDIGKQASHGE